LSINLYDHQQETLNNAYTSIGRNKKTRTGYCGGVEVTDKIKQLQAEIEK